MKLVEVPTQDQSKHNVTRITCQSCGSDKIVSLGTNRKGFSASKAIIGGAIAGPAGLLAGALGKGGKKTIWVCAKCGKQFTR